MSTHHNNNNANRNSTIPSSANTNNSSSRTASDDAKDSSVEPIIFRNAKCQVCDRHKENISDRNLPCCSRCVNAALLLMEEDGCAVTSLEIADGDGNDEVRDGCPICGSETQTNERNHRVICNDCTSALAESSAIRMDASCDCDCDCGCGLSTSRLHELQEEQDKDKYHAGHSKAASEKYNEPSEDEGRCPICASKTEPGSTTCHECHLALAELNVNNPLEEILYKLEEDYRIYHGYPPHHHYVQACDDDDDDLQETCPGRGMEHETRMASEILYELLRLDDYSTHHQQKGGDDLEFEKGCPICGSKTEHRNTNCNECTRATAFVDDERIMILQDVCVPHGRTSSNEPLEILCELLEAEKELEYLNEDFDEGCPNKVRRGGCPNCGCGIENGTLLYCRECADALEDTRRASPDHDHRQGDLSDMLLLVDSEYYPPTRFVEDILLEEMEGGAHYCDIVEPDEPFELGCKICGSKDAGRDTICIECSEDLDYTHTPHKAWHRRYGSARGIRKRKRLSSSRTSSSSSSRTWGLCISCLATTDKPYHMQCRHCYQRSRNFAWKREVVIYRGKDRW
jgi:hypothetical protein